MVKALANFFRGVHQSFGITNLPPGATQEEELRFVLMWLGILILIIVWVAFIFYILFRLL